MHKYLVMLIEEHRVLAAGPGDAQPVTINLPGRWSDQTPEAIGDLLKHKLTTAGLTMAGVVVGVPADWVLTQSLSVPSADPDVTTGAVKLRVSRDYATDAADLVTDYTACRSDAGSDVLIGVSTRTRLYGLTQALEHAGLKPAAIYVTAQAFVGKESPNAVVVRFQPPTAELARVHQGRTVSLQSLCDTLTPNDPSAAAHAITRTLVSDPTLSTQAGELVLASDPAMGLDPMAIASHLNGVANGSPTVIDESALNALRRRAGDDDMLDLLRARASRATISRWSPTKKASAAAAALVLITLLAVTGFWWAREHRLSSLRDTALDIQPQAQSLGQIRQRLDTSAPWFDSRIDMLACLKVLTDCAPDSDSLRLTDFRLNADRGGSLQGRAASRAVMLQFLNAMQASDDLTNVALRDSAVSQNGQREVRFEIAFVIKPTRGTR